MKVVLSIFVCGSFVGVGCLVCTVFWLWFGLVFAFGSFFKVCLVVGVGLFCTSLHGCMLVGVGCGCGVC